MAKTEVRGGQIADGANGVNLTQDVTGVLPAANGGTGLSSPGASGNVPTSNGSGAWVSQAPAGSSEATQSTAGLQSALDKKKEDQIWVDVTANPYAILVGNDSTDNLANFNTLLANAPAGSVFYFPIGTYRVSGEVAIPSDGQFRFVGAGRFKSVIKTTSATANIIAVGSFSWVTFGSLGFDSSATRTAGAAIDITAAAALGIDIEECAFRNQFIGIRASGAAAANLSIWQDNYFDTPAVNGRGIVINAESSNIILSSNSMLFGSGTSAVAGTACLEVNQSSDVQIEGCYFLGGVNAILLNADKGGSTSISGIMATHSQFELSGGSTIKVIGANVANRINFLQCQITTGTGSGLSAIEVASTGTGAAGTSTARADGLIFEDCDIFPNGTTGTTKGVNVTGAQSVTVRDSRIYGWTTGVDATPSVSNGYTKIYLSDTVFGLTNNNTTPNTTGVNLNAGSFQFGSISIANNDFTGSTTPLVDASTIASTWRKQITSNIGIVSVGGASTLPTTDQALTASAANLIVGTSIALPTNGLRIGSRFRWDASIRKTTASNTAWSILIKYGTANTTSDGTIATWTSASTVTGIVDYAKFTVEMEVLTLGASATAKFICMYTNSATASSGLGVMNPIPTSTATFNSTLTAPFLHLNITPGSLAVYTAVGAAEILA
jgi:hypothetical protein